MKASFLMIQILLCVSICAEDTGTLVPEVSQFESVEARRAEAMGKRMERFETMTGRIYKDVRITRISDAGISLSHADGAARLRFEDLSPEQRQYFGINGEDAAEVYAREMKARAAYEKLVEEKERSRRQLAEARAEAEWLAMEKAAEVEPEVAFVEPDATIPEYPTVKRVESNYRFSRSYRYHGGYYSGCGYSYPGYAYPVRYGYRPSFHYRGGRCGTFYTSGLRIPVR